MSNPSDAFTTEPSWWTLINKREALREQFPSFAKVRRERPGCAADIERKRQFREAAELRKAREHEARWEKARAENERIREAAERRNRTKTYKALQRERNEGN